MQTIDKQSVADHLILENLAELHKVKERLRIFEKKYGKDFNAFEKQIRNEEEYFEHYDDYIDWKAALKWKQQLEQRIEDLKHGHFKVA